MKRYKFSSEIISAFLLMLCFSLTAFANSSWAWISETRPYDVLPFVAVGTVAIETFAIAFFTKQSNVYKTLTGVFIGNLLSFALPYVDYAFNTPPYSGFYDLPTILNHGPFYTVGTVFLIMTLFVEVPFMYFWHRKDTESKKKLILVTVISNVVTTALVALVERTLCHGQW